MKREEMNYSLLRLINRLMVHPVLIPIEVVCKTLVVNQRVWELFYFLRSMPSVPLLSRRLMYSIVDGKRLLYPYSENPCFNDVYLRNVYYPYQPNENHVIIDVGAHMGFFTIKVADKVKYVLAIEPDPINFKFLCHNVALNRFSNVKCLNYALSERDGHTFLRREYCLGRSTISDEATPISVDVKRMDKIVSSLKLIPHLIKIDTEGFEVKVLKGALKLLKLHHPELLIAAYHYPDELSELSELLTGLGYKVYVYKVPYILRRKREVYLWSFYSKEDEVG